MLSRYGYAPVVTVVALALLIGLAPLLLVPAQSVGADGVVSVTVVTEQGPVADAFVTLTGSGGRFGGITDALGLLVLQNVPDGSYTVVASGPGTTVGQGEVTVSGGGQVTITVEDSGTKFRGLGAYGAHLNSIVPDGKSGVFYLTTEAIPSLYRTADYGGNWAPVTLASHDPDHGIDATVAMRAVASSGFPGEVAALANQAEGQMAEDVAIWYSRDFGVTWSSLTATIDLPAHERRILWGHVGDVSALFLFGTGSADMWYARLPTDAEPSLSPELVKMADSFKTGPADQLAMASGSTAPVLAVDPGQGSVFLYEVTAAPARSIAPSYEVVGGAPSATPVFVRLGGPATGPELSPGNRAPSTILTYAYDPDNLPAGAAIMSTYTGTEWAQTDQTVFKGQESDVDDLAGAFVGGPNSCAAHEGAIGSVSPAGAEGTVAMCWVTQEEAALVVRPIRGVNNNTGVAFDAAYDGEGNRVLISGDGGIGAVKSASMDPDLMRPIFPEWPKIAEAGTGTDSGGIAINGVDAAEVKDIAMGPTADDVVVALGGGGRFLASSDGGGTWVTVEWQYGDGSLAARGGHSVDWWESATPGTHLILGGRGGAGNVLGVLSTSGGVLEAPALIELPGTDGSSLGLLPPPEAHSVTAIAGVPGTNVAYVGLTSDTGSGSRSGGLRRLTLNGLAAPTISDDGLTDITHPVVALAYCPVEGSDSMVAGKLFVALAPSTPDGDDGGIAVFEGAAGSPAGLGIVESGAFNDVRVHCASGVVYAGRAHSLPEGAQPDWINQNGLMRSQDGGASFQEVVLEVEEPLAYRMRHVVAIGLNPADPDEVVVVGAGGDIVASADGGETWTVQNDTRQSWARHFGSSLNDIELPPPVQATEDQIVGTEIVRRDALLGSGAGLFSAAVRPAADGGGSVHTLYVPLLTK